MSQLKEPILYKGGIHTDDRGDLIYNNELPELNFDIKRFFFIEPSGMRGWHGHQNEDNLFTVASGLLKILLVKPDDWERPSHNLPVLEYVLSHNGDTLYVPKGYVSAMKCVTEFGTVMVCSNRTVQESIEDTFRFSSNFWYYESFF